MSHSFIEASDTYEVPPGEEHYLDDEARSDNEESEAEEAEEDDEDGDREMGDAEPSDAESTGVRETDVAEEIGRLHLISSSTHDSKLEPREQKFFANRSRLDPDSFVSTEDIVKDQTRKFMDLRGLNSERASDRKEEMIVQSEHAIANSSGSALTLSTVPRNEGGKRMLLKLNLGTHFNRYSALSRRICLAMNNLIQAQQDERIAAKKEGRPENFIFYDPLEFDELIAQMEELFMIRRPQEDAIGDLKAENYWTNAVTRLMGSSQSDGDEIRRCEDMRAQFTTAFKYLEGIAVLCRIHDKVKVQLGRLHATIKRRFNEILLNAQRVTSYNEALPGMIVPQSALESLAENETATSAIKALNDNMPPHDPILHKENSAMFLLRAMGTEAMKRGYRKQDAWCFAESKYPEHEVDSVSGERRPAQQSYPVNAYERVQQAVDLFYEISARDRSQFLYYQRLLKPVAKHVLEDWVRNQEKECARLDRVRHRFSFTNLMYDAKTDEMYPHNDRARKPLPPSTKPGQPSPAAAKFIRQPLLDLDPCGPHHAVCNGEYIDLDGKVIYNENDPNETRQKPLRSFMDILTPLVEKMLNDQGFPPLVKMWLYFMLGRLMFYIGSKYDGDDLQLFLFLEGQAGTGKSTLLKLMTSMYEQHDIFAVESQAETTFGLQSAINKWIWTVMEMKNTTNLDPAHFQKMVSGESIAIAIKNKDPVTIDYNIPGAGASNEGIPFCDAQGAVSRRVLRFPYKCKLRRTRVDLEAKLHVELPNLIRKCGRARHFILQWLGDRGIWDQGVLPDFFHASKDVLKAETDPIARFLQVRCEVVDLSLRTNDKYITPLEAMISAVKQESSSKSMPGKDMTRGRGVALSEDHLKSSLARMGLDMFELKNSVLPPRSGALNMSLSAPALPQTYVQAEPDFGSADWKAPPNHGYNAGEAPTGLRELPVQEEKLAGEQRVNNRRASARLRTEQERKAYLNERQARDITDNGIEVVVHHDPSISSVVYKDVTYVRGVFVRGLVMMADFSAMSDQKRFTTVNRRA